MFQVETLGYTQYEYTCRMVSLEVHSSLAAVGEKRHSSDVCSAQLGVYIKLCFDKAAVCVHCACTPCSACRKERERECVSVCMACSACCMQSTPCFFLLTQMGPLYD